MSMALERLWRMLLLTNPSPVDLSITSRVLICVWPISLITMCIALPHCKVTKRAPNSDYIVLARMFCVVVHLTCTGSFSGG